MNNRIRIIKKKRASYRGKSRSKSKSKSLRFKEGAKIESGMMPLEIKLCDQQFEFHDVPGDGNCFYHCLARSEAIQERCIETLRNSLMDWVVENRDAFIHSFVSDTMSANKRMMSSKKSSRSNMIRKASLFESEIEKHRRSGTFATKTILGLSSIFWNLRIWVHSHSGFIDFYKYGKSLITKNSVLFKNGQVTGTPESTLTPSNIFILHHR